MLKEMYGKALEVGEYVVGTMTYLIHKREYDAAWAKAAQFFVETNDVFDRVDERLDRPEHGLKSGFDLDLDDDSIEKRF